ncbi:cell envelope integrity protein TolA [Vibrio sp. MA40-2]|uniref:cell envelope integrity protein TolA n=1 Tax=Vibrio sp. MA40-2 TaxID=3391828 RepID=UPI0039A5BE26
MKKNNKLTSAIIISTTLHLLLVAVLLWGADFNMSTPKPTGNMVEAVVIDPALVQKQAKEIREKRKSAAKSEQERLDKLRKQSEQLEKNRQAEEARIRKLKEERTKANKATREAEKQQKLEQEKVRVEKERAASAEAERIKKQQQVKKAEQERVAKEAAAAKAEANRISREKAAQEAQAKAQKEKELAEKAERERVAAQKAAEKAEQERIANQKAAEEAKQKAREEQQRLKQLEKERKEREAALGDIFAGLEEEQAQNSSAKQQFVTSQLDRYGAIYKQLIQSKLLMDDSYRGRSCKVNLKLVPTGKDAMLNSFAVVSGDAQLCAATKSAVAQVNSFPLPTDQDIIDKLRNINLTVAPE